MNRPSRHFITLSPGPVIAWLAIAVLYICGCSSQQFSLLEQAKNQEDKTAQVVCSASRSLDNPGGATAPTNRQSATDPANVARLQKPENDPSKPSDKGTGPPSSKGQSSPRTSILDLAAYQTPTPNNGEVAANIRAMVNGTPILDEEVREAILPYLMATQHLPEPERSARRKVLFEQALTDLIEREVILQDMFARLKERKQVLEKLKEEAGKEFDKKMRETRKSVNVKTDEELKAFMRLQGLSLEGVRRQIERKFMAMEYMRNRIRPAIDRIGHEQIREYYEGHPEEFQVSDSVDWQDIFIDASKYPSRQAARQLATELIAKANAGEDFRQLVTKYDQGNSAYLNGQGYGHRRGEIKPAEAEPVLFKMREGEIGLIELTNGFHVIRLVKREHAGLRPFDDKTQTSIRHKLENEAWEREFRRIMRELKSKASIEVSSR